MQINLMLARTIRACIEYALYVDTDSIETYTFMPNHHVNSATALVDRAKIRPSNSCKCETKVHVIIDISNGSITVLKLMHGFGNGVDGFFSLFFASASSFLL